MEQALHGTDAMLVTGNHPAHTLAVRYQFMWLQPVVCLAFISMFAMSMAVRHATAGDLYREKLRPQYHFTAEAGYINDPNGLVYVDGVYHLFFQAGPITAKRWGHAVSSDLLHWKQLRDALEPVGGHPAFSGSAVVDHKNTSGFQKGSTPPLVAAFTSWGEGQCLAYSNDRGDTWQRYADNPVLQLPSDAKRSFPLSARDPHVMWDETRSRWVMVLYENENQMIRRGVPRDEQGGFSIFTSPDLKQWTRQSHLPGFYVCPDVFELPIEGETQRAWVAMDWAQYTTGDFDGETFTPDAAPLPLDFGSKNTLSANQTWKHLPDGRIIQQCWIRGGKYPGMPFDQQHSFPTSLSLRRVGDRLRLCKQPITELARLHVDSIAKEDLQITSGEPAIIAANSFSYDLQLKLAAPVKGDLIFDVLGQPILIQHDKVSVRGRTVELEQPIVHVRILADVTSLEIFINSGLATMTFTLLPPDTPQPIRLSVQDGTIEIEQVRCSRVGSIWNEKD